MILDNKILRFVGVVFLLSIVQVISKAEFKKVDCFGIKE
jgi:hypothetical protein